MPSRNTDVNLVIRARNEADGAIKAVATSLESLVGGAGHANTDVAELGRTLASLDKAFGSISGKADAAAAAFDRQAASATENRAALAALREQSEAATRAGESLRARIVDEVLAGRDQSPLIAQIRAVEQEQASLDSRAAKLTRTIATLEAALDGSRSSLLQLGSTLHAIESGQAEATARIELTTQALNEQAAAAQHVTAIQQRINDVTGVSRPAATGGAAAAASVLLEADNIFRRTEARTAEIQKLREQEVATAALADAERAEQANRSRFSITDDPRGAQARASAAVFIEAAAAEEQMASEAAQLRSQLDPLAAIQDRFNASLARYRELVAAGKLGTDDLAQAEQHLAAEAEQARAALDRTGRSREVGLFGLKPYELTNLGYQINDVATQLASGTSLTQTLGQQGGQILQIFPRVTSAIVCAFTNPAFLGAAAVLGSIVFALKEAGDQAERLRGFSASLEFRADGGSYDAGTLANEAQALDRLGASAKDADAAINALVDQGVAADVIGGLGRAAQETAKRLGESLPDAAKAAAEAFTGGYDAVAKFDDKLNFLTASEREHIRALFDAGNAEAGRTEARLAYQRMEDGIAAKSRGPWGEAARSLGKAWDALVDWIANTAPIKITIGVLNELAGAVKSVGDAISGALGNDKPIAASVSARIGQVQAEIRDLQKTIPEYEAAIAKGSPIAGTLQHLVGESKKQLAAAQSELGKLEKSAPDVVNDDPNGVAAKQRADDLGRISIEDQLQRLRDAGQQRILSAAEKARREELAGQVAARTATDAVVAAAEKRRAIAHETAQIEKETDARAKASAADREREIKGYLNAVVAAEGTGKNGAGSSAVGAGQFLRGTFVSLYKQINPSTGLGDDQIADLRNNSKVALEVLEVFTRQNAQLIERVGKQVNGANLYLLHFLGTKTGMAALNASGGTPIDQVIRRSDPTHAAQILSQNAGYLRTDKGKGPARTVSQLQTFLGAKVSDDPGSRAQTSLIANEADLLTQATQKQDEFNLSVRHGNEDRQRSIDALTVEAGLYGTALLAEQKRQAVAQAELELRQKAEDANKSLDANDPRRVTITGDQVRNTNDLAAAAFDAAHAKEALNAALADAQRPLENLAEQRDLLREQADYLRSIGEDSQADAIDKQVVALQGDLQKAYQTLIEFYRALSPGQRVQLGIIDQAQLDNLIAKLKLAQQQTQQWGKIAGVSAKDIAQAFASSAAAAFTNFINKVAAGKNVFKALGQSIREFAANFLTSVAQMILQLLAFAAVVSILKVLDVPVPTSLFPAGSKHTGGVAGRADGNGTRMVNPAVFSAALRYHNGGIAGLKPNEVPTILEQGEEVLTTGNPRHINNVGRGSGDASGQAANLTVVNVPDHDAAVQAALRRPAGERLLMNFLTENRAAVRAALG